MTDTTTPTITGDIEAHGKCEMSFTQRMTLHINGGSEFSTLSYQVLCDDKPTDITRHRRTNGSPQYKITQDYFLCGDEEFDLLATKGIGAKEWLESKVTQALTSPERTEG